MPRSALYERRPTTMPGTSVKSTVPLDGKPGKPADHLLQRNGNFRTVIDTAPQADSVRIDHAAKGEFALLYALVHPQTEVHAVESDAKLRNVARQAMSLPTNLHLHASAAEVPATTLHYRLDDGRKDVPNSEANGSVINVRIR